MTEQDAQLNLRPFQARELPRLLERKKAGIIWDMGLGKTGIASSIASKAALERWLIICPDNALSVWRDEAPRWIKRFHPGWVSGNIKVDLLEGGMNRELLWAKPYSANTIHLKVVTWPSFVQDWAVKTKDKGKKTKVKFEPKPLYNIPEVVILDETKRIRNKETQAFQILSSFLKYYTPEYIYGMTGTPGHEPKHFWTLLHCIDPKYFSSYWKFVGAFHQLDDGMWGLEVNEPRNLPQFHDLLRRYTSIVKEEDVASERPPITRQLLPINMDKDQARLYQDLRKDMMSYVPEDGRLLIAPNEFAVLTRIRQALVCPKILSPSLSVGAAIQDFVETVDSVTHNVIFCPFTAAQPHFKEYLESKGFLVHTLHGGITTKERDETLRAFKEKGGTLICSTLYAEAFSLEPATKSFAIGYDWDPDVNRQAEKRLHRLTTLNPITSYYYTYNSTFDYRIAQIVNLKQTRVHLTIPQFKEILEDDQNLTKKIPLSVP